MPKNILVVDDEASIRNLLTEFLTSQGYGVVAVASATEARKAVQQQAPNLVITDLQLEESDGLHLIEELKAILPHTPMMLLTGVLFDSSVIQSVLSKKVSSYLPKTSSLSRIAEEVQRLLGPA